MLYTNVELKDNNFDHSIAMSRYLHKYLNQKREFHRLKHHEKDYVFGWMEVTTDENSQKVFDLYSESEAKEYIFYNIILTYGEDVDEFKGHIYGPHGPLSKSQINKDQLFFDNYLNDWKEQIAQHKGPYLTIIAPMLNQKLKELRTICVSETEYNARERYCYAVFFYIYYKAKLYFEERSTKYLLFKVMKYDIVLNIYTFCHIFTRHYVPSLNRGLPNTMNEDISFIDINNFLDSLKHLIVLYYESIPRLTPETEYMLFRINGQPYIIWIKYKNLDEISGRMGFEVRSFYKCTNENDISRFQKTKEIRLFENCMCCIEQDYEP